MTCPQNQDLLDEVHLQDPLGGERLRFAFEGPFEGRQVRWCATLYALGLMPGGGQRGTRQYIEVGDESEQGIEITIGLPVERIDLPTVRNTVIMVRQYKRLRRGRHEW